MPDENGKPLRADANTPSPMLTNTSYDVIKDIVTLGFPALVTLYAGLAVLWGWPNTEQVVASAGLVITFLGVLLKIAQKRYEKLPVQYDGEFIVNDPDPEKETFRFDFDNSLARMAEKDTVRLKVVDLLPPDAR
ncbi:hypothetical protein PBI_CAMILLE_29 [Microbacterium phage Camille]|nr:hypothetical protein PBI_CAMILLE_29 [Microbacterium phage Camille]